MDRYKISSNPCSKHGILAHLARPRLVEQAQPPVWNEAWQLHRRRMSARWDVWRSRTSAQEVPIDFSENFLKSSWSEERAVLIFPCREWHLNWP